MTNLVWKFNAKRRDTIDMNAGGFKEFFRDPASLVRESLQNALDAHEDLTEPVRVRFEFKRGNLAPKLGAIRHYFKNLVDHKSESTRLARSDDTRVPILIIEDFATCGLTRSGDGGTEQDRFDSFWRKFGKSEKTAGRRGRFGMGKSVFPAASDERLFFGLSASRDGTSLLGLAFECVEKIGGREYDDYGFFRHMDHPDTIEPATKLDSEEEILAFHRSFGLARRIDGTEKGLSIVVPWVGDDYDLESVVRHVSSDFFQAVVDGRLEVDVVADGHFVKIEKSSIEGHAEKYFEDEGESARLAARLRLSEEVDVVRASCSVGAAGEEQSAGGKIDVRIDGNSWEEQPAGEKLLERIERQLRDNSIAAFRCLFLVQFCRKGDAPKKNYGSAIIVAERADDPESSGVTYVRCGMVVANEKKKKQVGGLSMLVVIDQQGPLHGAENILAEMLGDMENPAHTEWTVPRQRSGVQASTTWINSSTVLDQLFKIPEILRKRLCKVDEKPDVHLLSKFFPKPSEAAPARSKSKRRKSSTSESKEVDPPEVPKLKRTPSAIEIVPLGDERAFKLRISQHCRRPPGRFFVSMAYGNGMPDPFAAWDENDFDLLESQSNIRVVATDATWRAVGGNRLEVFPESPIFSVHVSGFDSRDFEVKIDGAVLDGEEAQ